ncbi:methyltransferase FGSG_00040 [Solanum dulcamara]|uniref:methyltransferase FGSG_00040 n=1 Tax=Solanum dulcamara TaxID=45834 RepID=UPI002485BD01|nr:methyltransferase FGSG_00040 [Solanum dulcamara]
MEEEEDRMQNLRCKATELLLRKEWKDSIEVYSELISLCHDQISNTHQNLDSNHLSKLKKSLCLALCNRAEARLNLQDFPQALKDCNEASQIGNTHFKTLLCKGKILLSLNQYGFALDCFKEASLDPHELENSETLNGYLEKCKKFEFLSRTGAFDISDWVLNKFQGKPPELAEYIGSIEIKKSEISGRGLFATKNLDCGNLLLVTKAIAIERAIVPESVFQDSKEQAQLGMWKNFIDKVLESIKKCIRTRDLICKLSNGENEDQLEVPDIDLFRPEVDDGTRFHDKKIDKEKLLNILDVNSLVEELISTKVLGKNSDVHGIGLWMLASFINHSCDPNVRRSHVGDHVMIHASKDIKAGEELTFAYFDVFSPFKDREEKAKNWGFVCKCKRCNLEKGVYSSQEMMEIEMFLGKGLDNGGVVYRLEENMRRWMVRGKGKGYLRSSFWQVYSEVYESERLLRKWGSKIPLMENVLDSVVDAVGSDERIVKLLMRGLKRKNVHKGNGILEMEKAMKLGRGLYGKIMKKQTLRTILVQLGN